LVRSQAQLSLATAEPKDVADALRSYRRRNQLTLQDVSDRIGVSVGTLSKLENQKGTPNFRTLTRIVQLLDLASGETAGESGEPSAAPPMMGRKTVTKPDTTLRVESDRAVMEIHAAELLKKDMFPMVARITLREVPPTEAWAQHEGEEFLYVLSGSIEVHMEHYRPFVLQAGESTYYDSGMRHVVISTEKTDAVVLSVTTSRDDASPVPGWNER
jgi:mannose-6-phosphate isomerase-like protein (cupin superfamily)/DNA-binding Xre family transcriptional regulator